MDNYTADELPVGELHLDLRNPRMPDRGFGGAFGGEEEALEYLVEFGALDEVVQSIALSGWMDVEPLIVLEEEDGVRNIVIEGNRRLAALRIVADDTLAKSLRISVPSPLHERAIPDLVRVWIVKDRKDARDFIGFKHINGPFKWDSYAKAKYAAEWLDDGSGETVDSIAKRLGDGHRTVARLVNGYRVLLQAETLGFDRQLIKGRFAFSHLYTALTKPAYRRFLGLPDSTDLLPANPVPETHRGNLTQLMIWLYGQDDEPSVIRSQNPDLNRLGEVIDDRTARAMLTSEKNLNVAYVQVEDTKQVFADAIFALNSSATSASALIGNYEGGDDDLEDLVDRIVRSVRGIQQVMKSRSAEDPA